MKATHSKSSHAGVRSVARSRRGKRSRRQSSPVMAVGMAIYSNSLWLGDDIVHDAHEALSAHEDGRFGEAVRKAGVCLEGLLRKVLLDLNISSEDQVSLGPIIGALRRSKKIPSEMLFRLNQANELRNSESHYQPKLKRATEGDSLQLISILSLVIDWYQQSFKPTARENDHPAVIPVFLSVGGPHRLDQEMFLQQLRAAFRELGVELKSIASGDYSKVCPFDQIRELMKNCRGALVVGMERSHAYTVFERERSLQETLYQNQRVPTAWNQIEGSIASALGLPVLILREAKLHREGVFESGNHRHVVRDFSLPLESKGLSSALEHFIEGWVWDVRGSKRRK